MVQDLGALKTQHEIDAAKEEQKRKDIVKLGRHFEETIGEYIKDNGDVAGDVVMGACKYIMELYQERMVGYMTHSSKMYGHLKSKLEEEAVKVHEPFENDGLESKVFAKQPANQNG